MNKDTIELDPVEMALARIERKLDDQNTRLDQLFRAVNGIRTWLGLPSFTEAEIEAGANRARILGEG